MSEEWRLHASDRSAAESERDRSCSSFALENLFAADERAKALVLLVAGRAANQVRGQSGELCVGVAACELEFDVPVEILEAPVAANLGVCRPKQPPKRLPQIGWLHRFSFSSGARMLTASS